jgi:hypothetical protein
MNRRASAISGQDVTKRRMNIADAMMFWRGRSRKADAENNNRGEKRNLCLAEHFRISRLGFSPLLQKGPRLLLLARSCQSGMSARRSLTGEKQTYPGRPILVANAPRAAKLPEPVALAAFWLIRERQAALSGGDLLAQSDPADNSECFVALVRNDQLAQYKAMRGQAACKLRPDEL